MSQWFKRQFSVSREKLVGFIQNEKNTSMTHVTHQEHYPDDFWAQSADILLSEPVIWDGELGERLEG